MICALCKKNPAIEQSHIVPAFIFRWLKESSPTGFLRNPKNPNKREQDGFKRELLCEACEDVFSKWETLFSNNVFRKVHHQKDNALAFDYDDWLVRFCVSVSWRTLTHLVMKNSPDEMPFGHGSKAIAALEHWRKYLLGEVNDLASYNQHLLITDSPASAEGIENDVDLKIYFKRAVHYDAMSTVDECYIITKMCDILICGTVLDSKPEQWIGTTVKEVKGRYQPGDFQVSGCVFKFFETAVEVIRAGRQNLSKQQGVRILDTFHKKNQTKKPNS
jgi:hypothetical protein